MWTKLKQEFIYALCFLFAIFGLSLCQDNFQNVHPVGTKTIDQITVVQNRYGKITGYQGKTSDDKHIILTKNDYQAWAKSENLAITRTFYHRYDDRLAVKSLKVDWRSLPLFLGGSLLVTISYLIRLILKGIAHFKLGNPTVLYNLVHLDLLITVLLVLIGLTQWSYTNYFEPLAFDFFQSSTYTIPTKAKIVKKKQTNIKTRTRYGQASYTTNNLTLKFQNDLGIDQRVIRDVPTYFYNQQKVGNSMTVLPYANNSGGIKISSVLVTLPNVLQFLLIAFDLILIWYLQNFFVNLWHTSKLTVNQSPPKKSKHPVFSGLLILLLVVCAIGQGFIQTRLTVSESTPNSIIQTHLTKSQNELKSGTEKNFSVPFYVSGPYLSIRNFSTFNSLSIQLV
jgi:hypothetical protein